MHVKKIKTILVLGFEVNKYLCKKIVYCSNSIHMRLLISFFVLCLFSIKSISQQSLYLSLFGDDALVAANIDVRSENPGLINYSVRGGLGVWSEWGKNSVVAIPHHLSLLFGKTHALELGASAAWRKGLAYRLHSIVGYRYQRRPSGLLIRAYIDPIDHGSFHYKFGLAVGHSF